MPEDTDQANAIDPLTVGELISIREASEISGLGADFLSQLAKKGRLKAKKMGRDCFTTEAAIEELIFI